MTKDCSTTDPARVIGLAHAIFGNEQKASRWLNKPKRRYGGIAPRQMLQTSQGLREVERLLVALQEGYF